MSNNKYSTELMELVRYLFKQINKHITTQIQKYCNSNCDQTRKMKIAGKIDASHYMVEYQGKQYNAFTRCSHNIGATVYVTICCGNYNDLIIN